LDTEGKNSEKLTLRRDDEGEDSRIVLVVPSSRKMERSFELWVEEGRKKESKGLSGFCRLNVLKILIGKKGEERTESA